MFRQKHGRQVDGRGSIFPYSYYSNKLKSLKYLILSRNILGVDSHVSEIASSQESL